MKTVSKAGDAAAAKPESVTIRLDDESCVSGLVQAPARARACYVVAHGAGAGMAHPFLAAVANGLAQRGMATLRYNFPYMQRGQGRPDAPKLAHSTVRAAVAEASRLVPGLPLFAGGKSFGGRMTSQAQAASPMPVHGLIFLGFPLHPPNRPGVERAEHLVEVSVPMLFLQGTRDEFAQLDLLEPLMQRLGSRASLKLFPDANHSFHVPARTGRSDREVLDELLDAAVAWMQQVESSRKD